MIDRRSVLAGGAVLLGSASVAKASRQLPRVRIATQYGSIYVELDTLRAPITAKNFLRYVDLRLYNRGAFYRVVRPDNDHNPATISVVQGGLDPEYADLPPIAHETTVMTGIRNTDGVLSMARDAPGSASSEFSISVGNNPALDFRGARNGDGQGFAAFGRVVQGMTIVRRLNRLPATGRSADDYTAGQILDPRVAFTIARV